MAQKLVSFLNLGYTQLKAITIVPTCNAFHGPGRRKPMSQQRKIIIIFPDEHPQSVASLRQIASDEWRRKAEVLARGGLLCPYRLGTFPPGSRFCAWCTQKIILMQNYVLWKPESRKERKICSQTTNFVSGASATRFRQKRKRPLPAFVPLNLLEKYKAEPRM